MSTRRVIVVECDRCHRKDEKPVGGGEQADDKSMPMLRLEFQAQDDTPPTTIDFADLCDRCHQSVGGMIQRIAGVARVKKES